MSEALNVSAPAEPVGSGDAAWDAAVAEATPTETLSEPIVASPDPISEPVAEPSQPEDFSFSTLENGERELRLVTGEVYRGKDENEVLANIAKGKVAASRRIQELSAPKAPETKPPETPEAPEIDPTSEILADMAAQGFGFKNAKEARESIAQMRASAEQGRSYNQELQNQNTVREFFASTPDFVVTPANSAKLGEVFDNSKLPITVENLKLVHYSLKGQGLYDSIPKPATSTARENIMPPAPNGSAPMETGKGAPTSKDFEAMSMEDLENYLVSASQAA